MPFFEVTWGFESPESWSGRKVHVTLCSGKLTIQETRHCIGNEMPPRRPRHN